MKLINSTDYPDHFLRRMVSWACKELGLPQRFVTECKFRNRTRAAFSGHAYHGTHSGRIVVSIGPDVRKYTVRTYYRDGRPMTFEEVQQLSSDERRDLLHYGPVVKLADGSSAERRTEERTEKVFPLKDKPLKRCKIERVFADRTEALVNVTAHELRHLLAPVHKEKTRSKRYWGSSEAQTERDAQRVLEKFRERREELLADWYREPAKRAVRPKRSRRERNEEKARKMLATWERRLKLAKTKVAKYKRNVRYYDRQAAKGGN